MFFRVSFPLRLSSCTMPPKSRKKRLNDEKATVAREGKKTKGDEPALEQQAIAQTHSASTETTPPAVDPEESDRSGATFNPEKEATSSTAHNLSFFNIVSRICCLYPLL